ncbi:MAG: DUF2231 domain-containing protein [Desulfobacterales bacterium]
MKEFTLTTLAEYNGENGKPIYIAHKGKVYNVSESKMWKGGTHMKRHKAGSDLSTDIQAAPHDPDVLERYPQIGVLKEEKEEEKQKEMPEFLSNLLKRFPMLRRHPHPMTVHFPIVFMFSTTVFTFLFLLTGIDSFETTAFHCLGAGVIFSVVAMATGWYTWWLNYDAKPLRAVTIKKKTSVVMLATASIAFILRAAVSDILHDFRGISLVYLIFVVSLLFFVTVIGWFGATLTFPVENE